MCFPSHSKVYFPLHHAQYWSLASYKAKLIIIHTHAPTFLLFLKAIGELVLLFGIQINSSLQIMHLTLCSMYTQHSTVHSTVWQQSLTSGMTSSMKGTNKGYLVRLHFNLTMTPIKMNIRVHTVVQCTLKIKRYANTEWCGSTHTHNLTINDEINLLRIVNVSTTKKVGLIVLVLLFLLFNITWCQQGE